MKTAGAPMTYSGRHGDSTGGGSDLRRRLLPPPPLVPPDPLFRVTADLLFDPFGHHGGGVARIVREVEGGMELDEMAAVLAAVDEGGDHLGVLAQGDLGGSHRGEGGTAEEGDPDAVHLGVLVDQHGEGAAAAQGLEELARRAARAAGDGGGA